MLLVSSRSEKGFCAEAGDRFHQAGELTRPVVAVINVSMTQSFGHRAVSSCGGQNSPRPRASRTRSYPSSYTPSTPPFLFVPFTTTLCPCGTRTSAASDVRKSEIPSPRASPDLHLSAEATSSATNMNSSPSLEGAGQTALAYAQQQQGSAMLHLDSGQGLENRPLRLPHW